MVRKELLVPDLSTLVDEILPRYGVSTESWVGGVTKSPARLFEEIQAGESVLVDRNGLLVREVDRSQGKFFHRHAGTYEFLKEGHQRYDTGNVRRRSRWISLSEKRRQGSETYAQAMVRGVFEELRVDAEPDFHIRIKEHDLMRCGKYRSKVRISKSYPTLHAQSFVRYFGLMLPDRYYRPEYVEYDNGKETRCSWVPWGQKLPWE